MQIELLGTTIVLDESALLDSPDTDIRRQVTAYVAGDRREFDLDVRYPDDFTGGVMRAMATIPYGETRTYGELAETLDTSAIAVGGACARNPVPVIVPCHRVLGNDGTLTGYSGADGVDTKRRLLELEARNTPGAAIQTTLLTQD